MISEVAKRYAKALFESVTEAERAKVLSQLKNLSMAMQAEKSVAEFFASPIVANEQKAQLVKALAGKLDEKVFQFLMLLTEKNRMSSFVDIAAAYEQITDHAMGITRGIVKTAGSVSDEQKKQIEIVIAQATHKKVELTYVEEPGLLGGLVAHVGGWTFDDSIATHLTQMGEELNRRSH